ncbi:SDR family NAD(P)-dependent oxidoreductase [Hazenella coriacea]|uniref:NAD(P)-dependent dehydrogenase (Short-subunit alcohol dehydrogenase family) n=1 Tax=Hazenella coriacea TaxID=1179467 RepID=A0A4R3L6S3_9BACL|nr:SDR family NAD(P)-dependent oxidoreductase [Hazenella coriacea]TCS95453.1 NAD(P)-dependent dehydrogenase (short-subunit alcohol dehydrogenase family) [Hazenella coriacea]
MKRLSKKIALVTGAASGIGKAITKKFIEEEALVIATDINKEALNQLKQEYPEVDPVVLNVTSEDDWKKAIHHVMNTHGRIDILVNNAGITSEKPIDEVTPEEYDKVVLVNSRSVFLGLKHTLPEMAKQKSGAVVNMASVTAIVGMGLNPYTASKGAVRAMSKAAATQYGHFNVRVNSVCPGVIETPMTQGLSASRDQLTYLLSQTPLQRLGRPEDIANAVLFLASDESSYVTGLDLIVDGGYAAK